MLRLDELAFSEDDHIYYLNGVEIPSVSKLIEPISNSAYSTISQSVLQNAADKGKAVHKAIELYNEVGVMDISPELVGYANAYEKWVVDRNPIIEESEVKVYHKLMRYAGTADCLARINDELWLIDYKTSYRVIDMNYRLQMEAYSQALSTHGITIDKKAVLHLKKDGRYEEILYPTRDADAWRVFGGCKSIYDWINKF